MLVSFDSGGYNQQGTPSSRIVEYTDFLMQRSLCLNVVFLELVIELLESFQVLDGDTHLLDFLSQNNEN
jgi:hypothetical protein